ncbi:hypothetical protein EON78_03460, partial [bacterium]
MLGFKTIRKGERYAVWNSNGQIKTIDGPTKVFLFNQDLQKIDLYMAEPDGYLSINYKDGKKENLRGPVSVWFDPVLHNFIRIEPMIHLEENQVMLVYCQTDNQVIKKIIKGPEMYMPSANEWTHEFSWHGSLDNNISNKKFPNALKFTKLRTIPDQMYFDVEDVRTSDDALIIVKVMIFFEIENLQLMLTQTHDPIADFINALTSDIIDFVSGLSFEKFKENTDKLNDLATYKQLVTRSEKIGYKIGKVVYRGYTANHRLQEMHNDAIESRTRLKLESETEDQAQKLADFKLIKDYQRSEKKREMEQEEIIHKNKMSQLVYEEKIKQMQIENDLKLTQEKNRNDLELENKIRINQA